MNDKFSFEIKTPKGVRSDEYETSVKWNGKTDCEYNDIFLLNKLVGVYDPEKRKEIRKKHQNELPQYVAKLFQIEHVMKKYDIESVEQLEEILKENQKSKSNLARWLALLETDGCNSKSMVLNDIQYLLKQLNDDTIKQSEGGK